MISLDDLKQRITPEPSQPNYKGLENKDKLILLIYACNYFFLAPTIKGAEAELGLMQCLLRECKRTWRYFCCS